MKRHEFKPPARNLAFSRCLECGLGEGNDGHEVTVDIGEVQEVHEMPVPIEGPYGWKPDTVEMAHEFHDTFGVPSFDRPYIEDPNINDLRVALLTEELIELRDALTARDLVEVLDALCDLQYVLDGSFLSLGLANVKAEAMQEVHRSNMSKIGADGRPKFRDDGKILKGPDFSPPDLKAILDANDSQKGLTDSES